MAVEKGIWFRKVLWGYIPCNAKGWLFLLILCAIVIPPLIALKSFSTNQSFGVSDALFMLILFSAVVFAWIVAERHSK